MSGATKAVRAARRQGMNWPSLDLTVWIGDLAISKFFFSTITSNLFLEKNDIQPSLLDL